MQSAIEAYKISKYYSKIKALDQISLNIKKGEFFGFLGPNGAGKTTFVKILLNLISASNGIVKILGESCKNSASRRNVGFLPEYIYCYPFLTICEYLTFNMQLIGGTAKQQQVKQVEYALRKLGIYDDRNKKMGSLSKGMKQRAGIAQAILNKPELLILDEPVSGLDPIGIKEIRDILIELNAQGTTIFLNSHLLSEIEKTCDRIAIIDQGKIIKIGDIKDLSSIQKHLEIKGEGFTERIFNELRTISGRDIEIDGDAIKIYLNKEEDIFIVHQIIINNGAKIYFLAWKGESLEDVFYKVVKKEVIS